MEERPGYKTTEFWVTIVVLLILGAVVVVRAAKTGVIEGTWELIAGAIAALGYSQSRGLTKSRGEKGRSR
jgi:hypothetical protein